MARRALSVLLILLVLALPALLIPWLPCGHCERESAVPWLEDVPGWRCPLCRDRGRRSLAGTWLRRPISPHLETLSEPVDHSDYVSRIYALLNSIGGTRLGGFPAYVTRFLPTDEGDYFVLGISGDHADYEIQRTPYLAFLLLFDLDGRLVDCIRVEDEEQEGNHQVHFQDPSIWKDVPIGVTIKRRTDLSDSPVNLVVYREAENSPPEKIAVQRGVAVGVTLSQGRFVVVP